MPSDQKISRREFLATVSTSAIVAPYALSAGPISKASSARSYTGKICFFSKHWPDMNWTNLAQAVKSMGFNGVDLTVRKGGHVLPQKAAEDLPLAVKAIREAGLDVPMITTELLSASDPTAGPILSTAGKLKIPFFKPGYYKYEYKDVLKELEAVGKEFRALVELAKQSGVQTGFHNHTGNVGAPIWDIAKIIEPMDPKWVGYYFDIRHAVAEGGVAGWKIATNMVAKRIKMIAVKDFYWEKTEKRGWQVKNCPLGEGMVDWRAYFKALAAADFQGPISLHLEYEIPGPTKAAQEENTIIAAKRDLEFLNARLQEAYSKS